jgi:hypothetical protein
VTIGDKTQVARPDDANWTIRKEIFFFLELRTRADFVHLLLTVFHSYVLIDSVFLRGWKIETTTQQH